MCGIDGTQIPKHESTRYAIEIWLNPKQTHFWVTATGLSPNFDDAKLYVKRGLGSKLARLKRENYYGYAVHKVTCEVW